MVACIVLEHYLSGDGEMFAVFCDTTEIGSALNALISEDAEGTVYGDTNPHGVVPADSELGRRLVAAFPNAEVLTSAAEDVDEAAGHQEVVTDVTDPNLVLACAQFLDTVFLEVKSTNYVR